MLGPRRDRQTDRQAVRQDLLWLRDVIGHVTIGSADPDYPTLEPNPKWIRCSVAEIYPLEDADGQIKKVRKKETEMHLMTSNLSNNKAQLS